MSWLIRALWSLFYPWKFCFSSGCLLNSPQKKTDSYFSNSMASAIELSVWFLSWQLLQHWPIFPRAEAASLILAQGSSSSLLYLLLSSSSLNFNSCLISSANFSRGLSNWRLLVERETSLVFSIRLVSPWVFWLDCVSPKYEPWLDQTRLICRRSVPKRYN